MIIPNRTSMPTLDADVRNKNFEEVATGYTEEMAQNEASRCLNCKNKPCQSKCPVGIDIPEFISYIKAKDYEGAYASLSKSTCFPAVCGRVCPQETQCESTCIRGIKGESVAIGRLERFVADYHATHAKLSDVKIEQNGHKVAVIGSGPAGLTVAGELAKKGYAVSIFEALHVAGGVLSYGIPEFRLPKRIVNGEVENLKKMGVDIETNVVIGRTLTIEDIFSDGYEAVFIGSGAGLPRFMNIPGETLNGVCSANEFLTRVNLMKAYKDNSRTPVMRADKVAVVGGGNVAMDAARCAKRLGASEVYIVYRRGENELPARREEVEHAKEEGIIFKLLTNPVEILGDEKKKVTAIRCLEMELGAPDASGRRRPVEKAGSEFDIAVDEVIMSIGTSPNPHAIYGSLGIDTDAKGCILADENGKTTREGVYAGGDSVTGAATVILAMGAGKKAAKAIDEYIQSKNV